MEATSRLFSGPPAPEIDFQVFQLSEIKPEFTTEIVRLLSIYSHYDERILALDLDKDACSARQFESLSEPGGVLFVADRNGRIEGLLKIRPDTWPSLFFGHQIWSIQKLVLDPRAPSWMATQLAKAALDMIGSSADYVHARLPSSDYKAIRGLSRAGFDTVAVPAGHYDLLYASSQLESGTAGLVMHRWIADDYYRTRPRRVHEVSDEIDA